MTRRITIIVAGILVWIGIYAGAYYHGVKVTEEKMSAIIQEVDLSPIPTQQHYEGVVEWTQDGYYLIRETGMNNRHYVYFEGALRYYYPVGTHVGYTIKGEPNVCSTGGSIYDVSKMGLDEGRQVVDSPNEATGGELGYDSESRRSSQNRSQPVWSGETRSVPES